MYKNVKITYGKHTYGEIKVVEWGRGEINVGKYCSITSEVKAFLGMDHNMNNISTYPFGHRRTELTKLTGIIRGGRYVSIRETNINIGNDVWIGYGTTLFRGVTIGDGAVIGAYSTITKDVPPYAIVVGSGRIVRKRFSDKDIDILLKLQWWNWTDEEVASVARLLLTPDIEMLLKIGKEMGKWPEE